MVVVGADGLVRLHTDHWSVASLLETKIGWLYNVGRRAFGAATSIVFGWLVKGSSSRVLGEGAGRAPTAPPIAGAAATSAGNSKAD